MEGINADLAPKQPINLIYIPKEISLKLMEILKILLGFRDENLTGQGIPRGLVMELRAIGLALLALTLLAGAWLWMKKEEKKVYLQQKSEQEGAIQR